MIRFKLSTPDGEVVVSLPSELPNKISPLEYAGAPRAILGVKRWLFYATGAFGHPIGDWTTPIDLRAAMASENGKRFEPVLSEETVGKQPAPIPTTDSDG